MKAKDISILEAVAAETHLRQDANYGVLFGTYRGYLFYVGPGAQDNMFGVTTSVCQAVQPPERKTMLSGIKKNKNIAGCVVNGFCVSFSVSKALTGREKIKAKLLAALDDAAELLSGAGYVNCCQDTGTTAGLDVYMCAGVPCILSQGAFETRSRSAVLSEQARHLKKESMVSGVVGALLGSLIGMAAIVLIGQLGYISAISGFIMAACTVKGYELLGGKISRKGVIISVVIMAAMVYIGNRADWALSIVRQLSAEGYDLDLLTSFQSIPYWISEDMLDASSYYGNLAMVYAFTALGAFPTIKNGLSAVSPSVTAFYRLGSPEPVQTAAPSIDSDLDDGLDM